VRDLSHFNVTPFGSISHIISHIKKQHNNENAYHIITANPEIVYEAIVNKEYGDIFHSAN
jgi:N-acetylglucosaminyldiphosphoundecaprenol N-acetyl-beta-D-mannosaminyltransferase